MKLHPAEKKTVSDYESSRDQLLLQRREVRRLSSTRNGERGRPVETLNGREERVMGNEMTTENAGKKAWIGNEGWDFTLSSAKSCIGRRQK